MRILVTLVVVAVVAAAPKKPTKIFPKKYDAAVHGVKDTYSFYQNAADEDTVEPDFNPFGILLPPLPALPPVLSPLPEDSSYTELGKAARKDALSPPPEDTYSSVSGVGHSGLAPPPASPAPEAPSSYLTFESPSEEPLSAPPTSTYAQVPKDASSSEVLRSLAAMIQALPHISSYSSYQPATGPQVEDAGPAREILPPPVSHSSYSSVPSSQPSTTSDQESSVALPSTDLSPPQ